MDFIDDFEDECSIAIAESEVAVDPKSDMMESRLNTIFIELMRLKPSLKTHRTTLITEEIILQRELLVVVPSGVDDSVTAIIDSFVNKLCIAKFSKLQKVTSPELNEQSSQYDIVVDLTNIDSEETKQSDNVAMNNIFLNGLIPGGKLIVVDTLTKLKDGYKSFDWIIEDSKAGVAVGGAVSVAADATDGLSVHVLQKRCVHCNENAAIYWRSVENRTQLETERQWIERVSVPISVAEYRSGTFSDASHKRAVHNILNYGVCIFPHLFNKEQTMSWGAHAKDDMTKIVHTLKAERGIDLLNPSAENPRIENFHELSMREALRCDLRNGKQMKIKAAQVYGDGVKSSSVAKADAPGKKPLEGASAVQQPSASAYHTKSKTTTKASTAATVDYHTEMPPCDNLRFHPAIRSILKEAMNPPAPTVHEAKGNWGRYNFEGPGPEVIPEPKIGQLGVVMSLPGCADQTIHADTSHIYVHTHLPPHYLNLFTPAIEREADAIKQHTVAGCGSNSGSGSATIEYESYAVGQTCFVVGSQTLDMTGRVMTTAEGQGLLDERLIRPHLSAGDALIFDCRILHFGLANQSTMHATEDVVDGSKGDLTTGWRPVLYVNYHQDWFHDPKNWNDAEKLFPENERDV